ncbi:MAG TPA: thioredoxin family protein [Abditibacterium sp.]|jgi:thiol-disulfide isomerase/thioredoxin
MENQSKRRARPWLLGALFVWALTGTVAITAMTSRPATAPVAEHDHEAAGHTAADHDPLTGKLRSPSVSQAAAPGAAASAPKPAGKATSILWEGSFEAAMQRAKAEKKPLMIDFYTDWCGVCKELDAKVLPDPTVISEAENWVSIKINAEQRPDVAGAYGVTGYPTIVFAENSGKPLDTLVGFAPAPEFVQSMQTARAKWSPNG